MGRVSAAQAMANLARVIQIPLLDNAPFLSQGSASYNKDMDDRDTEEVELQSIDSETERNKDEAHDTSGTGTRRQKQWMRLGRKQPRDSPFGGFISRYGWLVRTASQCPFLLPYLGHPFETPRDLNSFLDHGVVYAVHAYPDSKQSLRNVFFCKLQDWTSKHENPEMSHPGVIRELISDVVRSTPNQILSLLRNIIAQILSALLFLHENGISHNCLHINDILVSGSEDQSFDNTTQASTKSCIHIQICNYSLPWLAGRNVTRGNILEEHTQTWLEFAAPEVLFLEPGSMCAPEDTFHPQGDVWALGMLLASLVGFSGDIKGSESLALDQLEDFANRAAKLGQEPYSLADEVLCELKGVDINFHDLLRRCLYFNPQHRDSVRQLLSHPFLAGYKLPRIPRYSLWSEAIACPVKPSSVPPPASAINQLFQLRGCGARLGVQDHLLNQRYSGQVSEATALLEEELRRAIFEVSEGKPVNDALHKSLSEPESLTKTDELKNDANNISENPEVEGTVSSQLWKRALTGLKFSGSKVNQLAFKQATGENEPLSSTQASNTSSVRSRVSGPASAHRHFVLRRIVEIQQVIALLCLNQGNLQLNVELRRLVERASVAATVDGDASLSVSFRSLTWLALLNIPLHPATPGSEQDSISGAPLDVADSIYLEYDILKPLLRGAHPVNHQLVQDIPRCHQYHPALQSGEMRKQIANVLKAWVLSNPKGAYWQGMDSLAATICVMFPGNEPVAFTVFNKFVATHLAGLFTAASTIDAKVHDQRIHQRLSALEQMLTFHDPVLAAHLQKLGVEMEHFALPWILTMFAHVLPIETVWRMWDFCMVREPGRGVSLLCVTMLVELREVLFNFTEFGETVSFLTRLPICLDELAHRCLVLARAADKLSPELAPLSWSAAISKNPSITLQSPSISWEAVLRYRPKLFLVRIDSSDESQEVISSATEPRSNKDAFSPLQIKADPDLCSSNLEEIVARCRELSKTQHVIALFSFEQELITPVIEHLVTDLHFPFVCLLEGVSREQ